MVKQTTLLVLASLLLALLWPVRGTNAQTLVEQVRISANQLDLARGESLQLTFTLAQPAMYSVYFSDMEGNVVRTLAANQTVEEAGTVTLDWDGLDNGGMPCPEDVYFPIIEARSQRMGSYIYNPTALPWGETLTEEPIYDNMQQIVSFDLTHPFYGRLLVGNPRGGPMYTILEPWQVFTIGAHEIPWNGMDSNNIATIFTLADVKVILDGYTLPENSVLITGDNPKLKKKEKNTSESQPKKFPVLPPNGNLVASYAMFSKPLLPDPEITITLQKKTYLKNDIPTVKGKISFRVDATNPDGTPMSSVKDIMEVAIYDGPELLTESYLYKLPAKLDVDTSSLTNGEHFITINVRAPDFRLGTFSGKLVIDN